MRVYIFSYRGGKLDINYEWVIRCDEKIMSGGLGVMGKILSC